MTTEELLEDVQREAYCMFLAERVWRRHHESLQEVLRRLDTSLTRVSAMARR